MAVLLSCQFIAYFFWYFFVACSLFVLLMKRKMDKVSIRFEKCFPLDSIEYIFFFYFFHFLRDSFHRKEKWRITMKYWFIFCSFFKRFSNTFFKFFNDIHRNIFCSIDLLIEMGHFLSKAYIYLPTFR